MQIGIGLPATIPGVRGDVVLDWARRADAGPFSSLGIIDRLVYSNYEPLVTLAAAAGATQRIRLMTTILIAPLRNTGVLAKQAASLDALSSGRLTLGLGVGGREDDFRFAAVPFHNRGRRFEEQLDTMYRVWSGQQVDGLGPVGPAPGSLRRGWRCRPPSSSLSPLPRAASSSFISIVSTTARRSRTPKSMSVPGTKSCARRRSRAASTW